MTYTNKDHLKRLRELSAYAKKEAETMMTEQPSERAMREAGPIIEAGRAGQRSPEFTERTAQSFSEGSGPIVTALARQLADLAVKLAQRVEHDRSELLEALVSLVAIPESADVLAHRYHVDVEVIERARDAIAKARGDA